MQRRDFAVAAAVAAASFAFLALFSAPRRLPMVDEGAVWTYADEILRGRAPYVDFDLEYTPVAHLAHAAYARLAGPSLLRGRYWISGVAAAGAVAAFLAARTFAGPAAAAAAAAGVLVGTFPYHTYASYNVYAVTVALAAAAMTMRAAAAGRAAAWAAAGAATALAFWTKQNVGGLLGLGAAAAAVHAAWRDRRPGVFFGFAAGALGGLAAGLLLLAAVGWLPAFLDQAVIGPLARAGALPAPYPLDQAARLADLARRPSLHALDAFAHSASFLAVFASPLLLGVILLSASRRGPPAPTPDPSGAMAALVPLALASAFGAAHEPTTWHIAFARPLPVLAAGACLVLVGRRGRSAVAVAAAVAAAYFGLHLGRQVMIFDEHDAPIRAGRAAGIRLRAWEARWIDDALAVAAAAPRGETLWIASNDILYYHLLDRPLPVRESFIEPDVDAATGRGARLAEDLLRADVRRILYLRGRSTWHDLLRLEPLRVAVERDFEVETRAPLSGGLGEAVLYRRRALPEGGRSAILP